MTTPKPDNPIDRRIAIMDAFDAGTLAGAQTAQAVAEIFGGTPRGIVAAFKDLGFTVARRASTRRVPTGNGKRKKTIQIPREYAKPAAWPDAWELRRRLRRMGMSASRVKDANKTTVPDRYVESAIGEVLLSNPAPDAINRRGAYKKALRQVVADGTLDTVSVRELAEALGENPDIMTPAALINRARGYMRGATKQELRETQRIQQEAL